MTVQPDLVGIYLVNATRCSAGNGPGPVQVHPDEAARLVAGKLAVYGSGPPQHRGG